MICLICGEQSKNSRSLAAHIRCRHRIAAQTYYDFFFKTKEEGICTCGKHTMFKSILQGYCEFCSYICAESARAVRISITKKGKSNFGLLGYKQARTHIERRILRGENHPFYNPDITEEEREDRKRKRQTRIPGYVLWRSAIFERDNFTCQVCGKYGTILNAHHLEAYSDSPELRMVITNGVTLCSECHRNFHYLYGYHCTEEQFIEFKADNVTEVIRFDLKDIMGNPAHENVYERVRV